MISKKKFYYLWLSQMLSQVTVNIMNALLLTRLFAITGSSIATSLLWTSYALPAIFFGPIGAAAVDFVDRRKMLMITNFLQALVIFAFIFTHESSIFLLYLVVLAYSFLNQFYLPAENASVPSVVSKENLPEANSRFFMTQQAAVIVGFGVAGIFQKFLGFEGVLILCSLFLFLAFVSVSFLPTLNPGTKIPSTFEKVTVKFFRSIFEGYQFIKGNKLVYIPFLLLLGIQVVLSIVIVNLPAIGEEILKVSVNYAGILVVVPAGIGAFAGSIYFPKLLKKGARKLSLIRKNLLLLGMCLLGVVFVVPFFAIDVRLIVNPIFLILAGVSFVGISIPTLTFLQEVTPIDLRGRVFGNMWFLVTIATILPVLFSGIVSEFFGVKILLSIISFFSLLAFYFAEVKGEIWIQTKKI